MSRPIVDRPVFVVGCRRSGTTLFYRLLARYPSFAWFSNDTQRWPSRPELAVLSRVHRVGRLRRWGWRGLPYPAEGHAIFDRCRGGARPGDNAPLTEADLTPEEAGALHRAASNHHRFQGGNRFLNKTTRDTRRIRYLDVAFADARFVHLVRNPQATAASLLRVAFWPDLPIWRADERAPSELSATGAEAAAIAGEFRRREVHQVVEDSSELPPARVHTLRDEDLVADPVATITAILRFAAVDVLPTLLERLGEVEVADRNARRRPSLGAEQLAAIDAEVASTARTFGYGGSTG